MEVPRFWRNEKQRYSPTIEQCGCCGEVEMSIRRPVCGKCGLVFEPEAVVRTDGVEVSTHRVVGKKMRVYFAKEVPEEPTLVAVRVDLGVRSVVESKIR